MRQAVIYTRFSPCPDADENQSCERQEERCISYCNRKGHTVADTFSDKSVSGKELLRSGLSAAIDALSPGMVFVVDRNDRLARDMLVALTIRHEIEKKGCHIECADGTPTQDTAEGELFANILGAFAQFERRKIGERTKAGLARKKANGQYLGRCPIGYRRDAQGKLIEHTDEQNLVGWILHWHGHGTGIVYIAARMQHDYGNIRGKPWNERTIRRIIQRELKESP